MQHIYSLTTNLINCLPFTLTDSQTVYIVSFSPFIPLVFLLDSLQGTGMETLILFKGCQHSCQLGAGLKGKSTHSSACVEGEAGEATKPQTRVYAYQSYPDKNPLAVGVITLANPALAVQLRTGLEVERETF